MSTSPYCCLCSVQCGDYKPMQSNAGESTEFYNITVKYFDPMLLTDGGYDTTSSANVVLCEECWSHIEDFHAFQQTVLNSRAKLKDVKENDSTLEIKEEEVTLEIFSNNHCSEDDAAYDSESCDIHKELYYGDSDAESVAREETAQSPDANECSAIVSKNNASSVKLKKRRTRSNSGHTTEDNEIPTSIKRRKRRTGEVDISIKYDHNGVSTTTKEKINATAKNGGTRAVYTLEKGKEMDSYIAQWKPNLDCDLCPTTAKNFETLRLHFREEHKTRFYIKCCDRKFYRRCILVDHIRLHVNPETHKCDICGKSSTSKYNLKLHKKIVHNQDRDFECEICHKTFNHKPTLDRHLLTHATGDKEFFCKECGKGYVMEMQLNTHIRNVHNGIRICDQCGKTFHNAGTLKKHLVEHGVIPRPKFPCDLCAVELKSNEALKRHKAAYHHDGSTVYICSICGKTAASEHALLSHKKFVHEDNRKHKCTFCDKAFRTATVLREHIATHTGEDLYQCPHCTQTFKTNANMHHHRKRVHPVEWAEARKNRLSLPKVNEDFLRRQVIL